MGKSSTGKALFSIAGFFLGAGEWNPFGIAGGVGGIQGGLMGMSLGSNIWSATHKSTATSYSRFDQLTNTISSESMINLIYGTRKYSGNQLWHKTNKTGKKITKDILVGEGTVSGVYGVLANDLMVTKGAVMKIKNIDYPDATIRLTDGNLRLYANGVATNIKLHKTQDDITYFDYNVDVGKLIAYIGRLGNGWVVVDPVGCANLTTELISIGDDWTVVESSDGDPETGEPAIAYSATVPCYNSLKSIGVKGLTDCSYTFHNGSPTQEPPSNYTTVGGYKNMSYLRVILAQSDRLSGGNPTITYICQGKIIEDTRTNTYAVSSNPAMITRDLLLSKRYGVAKFVPGIAEMLDEESFKEAADYCDELVSYKDSDGFTHQEPRYSLNIILDQKQSISEMLDDIFANFGGFLVFANGQISLRIEKSETSSYTFTNDSIIENSVSFKQLSIDETPNQYSIGYFDPSQNWTQVRCLVEDTIDQQPSPIGRGKVIQKELTLSGCTSQSQAIRLGRLYKLKNKLCSLTINFKTTFFAMHLQPGDVINLTYDKVVDGVNTHLIEDMPWRILEIQQQNGTWSIKAQQYNSSIYGDITDEVQIKTYTPIESAITEDVSDVTNLDIIESWRDLGSGVIANDVEVTWDNIDTFYREAEVYMLSSDTTWKLMGKAYEKLLISNMTKDTTATFKVVAVNSLGRKATFDTAPTVSVVVQGKTTAPSTPTGLTVDITNTCEWNWDALDKDCDYAELRLDQNPGSTTGLLVKTSSTQAFMVPPTRHSTVYLYAHNTAGYYSLPCVFEYNKVPPSAPTNVLVTDAASELTVSCSALPTYCTGIDVYINNQAYFSPNNMYTMKVAAGIYEVKLCYLDIFGEGTMSTTYQKVVKSTIDPELLVLENLSLTMMDTEIQEAVAKAQVAIDATDLSEGLSSITSVLAGEPDAAGQYHAITKALQTAKGFTTTSLENYDISNGIYVKGTGLNRDANRLLKINGTTMYDTSGRGLRLTVVYKDTLVVHYDTTFDTYGDNNAREALATALNAATNDDIVILSSYDAVGWSENLINALIRCGSSGVGFDVYGRLPYALIGTPGLGKGTALERFTTQDATAPYAEIYTKVINGIPQGYMSTGIQSQITQTSTGLNSVITELGKPLAECTYTAISQTLDNLQFRASDGTVKSLLNIEPSGITIDSKYVHITGQSVFDSDCTIKGTLNAECFIGADATFSGTMNFPSNTNASTIYNGLNLTDDGVTYKRTMQNSTDWTSTTSLGYNGLYISDYDTSGATWWNTKSAQTHHGRHYTGTLGQSAMLIPSSHIPGHMPLNGIFVPRSMPLKDPLINKHAYVSYRVRSKTGLSNDGNENLGDNNMAVVGEIYVPAVATGTALQSSTADITGNITAVGTSYAKTFYGVIDGGNASVSVDYVTSGTGSAVVTEIQWKDADDTDSTWETGYTSSAQALGRHTATFAIPSTISGHNYAFRIYMVSKTGTVTMFFDGTTKYYSSTDRVLRNNITLDYHVWEDGYQECGGKSWAF